jgi:serine/threonine protein kinase
LREDVSERSRYTALRNHVTSRGLDDCVVTARWYDDAITVQDRSYPMIDMAWIEGQTLEAYVEDLVDQGNTAAITALADRWRALVSRLQSAQFAHGDLQHGNVLIDNQGVLRLVDLDGCWITSFAGKAAPPENGHPNYQHPRRVWGPAMDTFPGLVIYTALLAVSQKPAL